MGVTYEKVLVFRLRARLRAVPLLQHGCRSGRRHVERRIMGAWDWRYDAVLSSESLSRVTRRTGKVRDRTRILEREKHGQKQNPSRRQR